MYEVICNETNEIVWGGTYEECLAYVNSHDGKYVINGLDIPF